MARAGSGARGRRRLEYSEEAVKALLEALEAGEVRKPSQVAKREVFRRYGLLGSELDRVFTAIIYKIQRMAGVLDRAAAHALGVNVEEVEGYPPLLRQSLRLAAFLAQFDEVRDKRLASALVRHGLRYLASRLGWREARKVHKVLDRLWDHPWRPSSLEEELMLRYLVPPDFITMLRRVLPESEVESFLESLNRPPVLGLRVNTLKADVDEVLRLLRSSGLEAWPSERVPGVIRYRGAFNATLQRLLKEGKVVPQDESSAAAAILLDPRPGEVIADLCAAPGGKTTHIAELTRNSARILAFDVYWDRLERLKWLAEATGTRPSIAVVAHDSTRAHHLLGENSVDRVLLDPPCSTTGGLHKNVDARWRVRRGKIEELAEQQKRFMEAAVRILKPGGRLLYTVCSALAEEGEDVVRWALERFPVRLVPLRGPYDESPLLPGTIRAWPHRHGTTGFYYALLEKIGPTRGEG